MTRKYTHHPQHMQEQVIKAYLAGDRVPEIAARHAVALFVVRQTLRKANIGYPLPRPPTQQQLQMIVAYQAGASLEEAATVVGLTRGACAFALRRYHVPQRTPSETRRTYARDETFFDEIDSEEKAYWLGFIAADGCIHNRSLVIRLCATDRAHLLKLTTALKYAGPIHDVAGGGPYNSKPQVHLGLCSERLTDALQRHGITPAKSLTLAPWCGPDDLMRHYWRGVLDGDGWWSIAACGRFQVGLGGSLEIVRAFAQFMRVRLGAIARVSAHKSIFRVAFGSKELVRGAARFFYQDASIWLDSKRETVDRLLTM